MLRRCSLWTWGSRERGEGRGKERREEMRRGEKEGQSERDGSRRVGAEGSGGEES